MAASSFNMISLPNSKLHLQSKNLTTGIRFNLKYSSSKELKLRTKTTSFARINNEEQDGFDVKKEEDPAAMMSQPEQIVRLVKGLVAKPVSTAEVSLRFFLAAVAVIALVPGGSWEWWLAKSVVCGGLVFYSVFFLVVSVFIDNISS